MKTIVKIVVPSLAVAAVALAGGWWVAQASLSAAPPVAARVEAPAGVGALGRVEPASRVRKLDQPGGMAVTRVERLLVAEGDRVEAGQLLAEFADVGQKDAAVTQAGAGLAEATAQLARTRAAGRPSEVAAQRARIAGLAAQEEISRRDAQRTDRLAPSGAGTEAAAERNRFAAQRAAAERAQAEADLATLTRARPEDLALAEARVAQAEASLAKARADAELARVRAPIAGTILKIYARPGDQVGKDGLLDLADLGRIDVVADVFETDLPRVRLDAEAEIVVPGEARRFQARVREIGWQVRRTTQAGSDPVAAVDARTVEVRLSLADDARQLLERRTNMQVQVAIRP
jgi:HlyD family secretion protein